jgi:hypothetical protein
MGDQSSSSVTVRTMSTIRAAGDALGVGPGDLVVEVVQDGAHLTGRHLRPGRYVFDGAAA